MDFFTAFRMKDGTKAKGWANNVQTHKEAAKFVQGNTDAHVVLVGLPTPPGVVSSPIPDQETEVQTHAG